MKSPKSESAIRNSLTRVWTGIFCQKGFLLVSKECLFNCFPYSVVDRPTTAYVFGMESITLASTTQVMGETQDTGRTRSWAMAQVCLFSWSEPLI